MNFEILTPHEISLVTVQIENQQSSIPLSEDKVASIVSEVIQSEGHRCDEVAVHFVDIPTICQLHADYFDDPSPTDTISFPIDEADEGGYRVLGEVFVCPAVAIQYTLERGGDPFRETVLYLIHGLLHLMGYDDLEAKNRQKMRAAEKFHLSRLEKLNLLEG